MKKQTKDIQMLGPQMTLEGTLVFEGSLILNGHAQGTIESKEGTILVGEKAVIHGDIFVRNATISGEIRGTVKASERIELRPPARVFGDLTAPVVLMDAGVTFDGKCTTEGKYNQPQQDASENQPNDMTESDQKEKSGFIKSLKGRKKIEGSSQLENSSAETT